MTVLLNYKPFTIPLDSHVKLSNTISSSSLLQDPTIYRSIVGKLLYLINSRHDISFSVHILSQIT